MSTVASTPARRWSGRYEPLAGASLTLAVDVDGPRSRAVVRTRSRS